MSVSAAPLVKARRRIPVGAAIGLSFTGLFLFTAIFAPLIAPHPLGESVGDVWMPMSGEHWLGTDNLGRDMLSRMMYGARTTIFIAAVATALSFTLGSILGFTAAVVGGWFDMTMSRFVDLLMSIPTLIFGLVVLSVLPTSLVTPRLADRSRGDLRELQMTKWPMSQ